jgi:serine/threonine protein kinase
MGDSVESTPPARSPLASGVAVKALKVFSRSYFHRELQICARVYHPNIVRLIDCGETDDALLYAVFEFIPGKNLAEILADERALGLQDATHLLIQVLDALACAHRLGIIHRDLKPQNIMVTQTGVRRNAKVLDFGIGTLVSDPARWEPGIDSDEPGSFCGTVAYASPEQLRIEPLTARSDLYSWGLVFIECLTGVRVHRGSAEEVIAQQLGPDPVAIPEGLEDHVVGHVLKRATAKNVLDRATTAESLLFELERRNQAVSGARPPDLARSGLRPRDRAMGIHTEPTVDIKLSPPPPEPGTPRTPSSRSSRSERSFYQPMELSLASLLLVLPRIERAFFGRDETMAWLDSCFDDRDVNGVALVASGGVGKSAVVRHWLLQRFSERPDLRYLGVSFYSQGTREHAGTADQFIAQALEVLGEPGPPHPQASVRAQRLAARLRERPTLLILDGIEPLQFGPGQGERGALKDPGLRELLTQLLDQPGRCFVVVTSRLHLSGATLTAARFRQRQLGPLGIHDACAVLRAGAVTGTDAEVLRAAEYLECHPLALNLAAEYVRTYEGGSVERITRIPLVNEDLRGGRHAKSMLAAHQAAIRRDGVPADLELLRLLGLFDRPAALEWIQALSASPGIPGVTAQLSQGGESALWESLGRLETWGLLVLTGSYARPHVDAHPLIREYFGVILQRENPAGWRAAHDCLARHLAAAAPRHPDSLAEMLPLLTAIMHACKAGHYRTAFSELYLDRVMRGPELYAAHKLGAPSAILSALVHFFADSEWSGLAEATERGEHALEARDRITLLSHAGMFLTFGRGYAAPEVERCYGAAAELCSETADDRALFEVLFGLWRYRVVSGQIRDSADLAARMQALAQRVDDAALLPASERVVASTCFYSGDFRACERHARRGVAMLDPAAMLGRAKRFLNEPSLSCMHYLGCTLWMLGDEEEAQAVSGRAVALCKEIGHSHTLSIALLFEAMLQQFSGNSAATARVSDELIQLCVSEGFGLWEISGRILREWAQPPSEGRSPALLASLVESWLRTGARLFTSYWLSLLADAYDQAHQHADALAVVRRGLVHAQELGEHWWEAELMRQEAVLLVRAVRPGAEQSLRGALDLASTQGASSLERRVRRDMSALLGPAELTSDRDAGRPSR